MKKLIFLLAFITLFVSCKSDKKEEPKQEVETTVYYLIRHAEKDRSIKTDDPELTEKGLERANNWAKILNNKEIDLVYSTDYKRTQQTASPFASTHKLEILSYDSRHLYNDEFKAQTKGKTVLIVGHSNTTPAFVNTILGSQKYDKIDDSDNGKLFIVSIVNDSISVKIEDYN
ncbi:MAG: histidine phosphatase family protein [Flavobacteriaceae bacterium]|nr:histidine phosphatase family protein [Flavobacteriaceae bacterium]